MSEQEITVGSTTGEEAAVGEQLRCGDETLIGPECADAKLVPFNINQLKTFMTELTNTAVSFITIAQMALVFEPSFGYYQAQAVQSLACVLDNIGSQLFHFLAAIYWVAVTFDLEDEFATYVNDYYPMICECTKEINELTKIAEKANQQMTDAMAMITAGVDPNADEVYINLQMFEAIGFLYPAIFRAVFAACNWVEQIGILCVERQAFVDQVRATTADFNNGDPLNNFYNAEALQRAGCQAMMFDVPPLKTGVAEWNKETCK